MKLQIPSKPTGTADRWSRAYSLLECLLYIAVLALVMALAFGAFYRCLDYSRDLARQTDDILRAIHAGELWRADIRRAAGPPELLHEPGLTSCEIRTQPEVVAYIFADGKIWRKVSNAPPVELVLRVAQSVMVKDQRAGIESWRWELELTSKRKNARVRPLFTFQAVAPPPGQ